MQYATNQKDADAKHGSLPAEEATGVGWKTMIRKMATKSQCLKFYPLGGHKPDLMTVKSLNRRLRDRILTDAEVQYAER